MPKVVEELIEVAEDTPVTSSEIPPDTDRKSISRIEWEVLIATPYRHTEREFFKVVHFDIRGRHDLKIDSYSIKRMLLVKQYGWGIHRSLNGTLALVPMESERYKELQRTVNTTKAYRNNKASK